MEKLTSRQRQILTMRAQGLSNQQIALKLDISNQTVNNHCYETYNRLGLKRRNAIAAIVEAIRTGQITLG